MDYVKLEILRNGPPHNQLLSPLTQYVAVCGDHPAVGFNVPFEHEELGAQLRRLGSDTGDKARETLEALGREMGKILAQVPGLVADLGHSDGRRPMTHVRVILSANELALLPFEVATGGGGLPGSGQHLVLQTMRPVCITREIRSASASDARWPSKCRILLAAAAPSRAVPLEAVLLALRQSIEAWMPWYDDKSAVEEISKHLEVLPQASPRKLADAIGRGGFTHVHLLAHGAPLARGDDKRFGVALHDDADPAAADVVDAERLATLLRARQEGDARSLARPTVVTLAICDAGNVGGVISSGASLAHELHRAGIPLVVASQFPVSFPGAVHLARLLYGPLLAGQHPCIVLDDVRRNLKSLVPQHHDWAGLVVYASLPPDLPAQLLDVRFERGWAKISAAMNRLDMLAGQRSVGATPVSVDPTSDVKRFEAARETLLELLKEAPDRAARIHGLIAGAQKRAAETLWRLRDVTALGPVAGRPHADRPWVAFLKQAEEHYRKAFAADRSSSWALVQSLALRAASESALSSGLRDEWTLTHALSDHDRRTRDQGDDRFIWAMNDLVELDVLAHSPGFGVSPTNVMETEKFVDLLRRIRPSEDFALHSLRRQLARYSDGFLCGEGSPAATRARHLLELLTTGRPGKQTAVAAKKRPKKPGKPTKQSKS